MAQLGSRKWDQWQTFIIIMDDSTIDMAKVFPPMLLVMKSAAAVKLLDDGEVKREAT